MTARVVVLGGGVGGTIVANRLAAHRDVDLTLVDNHGLHLFQPGLLHVPLNGKTIRDLERPESELLRGRVRLRVGRVREVDPVHRKVRLEDGDLDYDWLVIATGSRILQDDVPGLKERGFHFHCAKGAMKLQRRLQDFQGGRVVIGAAALPYKCPPSIIEFALLFDEWLRERKLRDKTEIAYTYPIDSVFAKPEAAAPIRGWLEERGIRIETSFVPATVDAAVIASKDGRRLPFDLLVMVPPHRGAPYLRNSALAGPSGFVTVDPRTLRAGDRVYALGDTADLPVPKSGSAAHHQAAVVAANIRSEILGSAPAENYDGRVACFLEVGGGRAALLKMDYAHPPVPPRPSRIAAWKKRLFAAFYFGLVRRA